MGAKLTDERRGLAERYWPFIVRFASRRMLPGEDLEDVIQDSALGLCRAAITWRPDKGAKFGGWAAILARGEIGDRRRGLKAKPISRLPETIDIPDGRDDIAVIDDRDAAEALLRYTSGERRAVVRMKYLDGMKGVEIAQHLGKSKAWITKQCQAGLDDIRRVLERKGVTR